MLVKENIGFGKIENLHPDPTVRQDEDGVYRSGGKWQIALARACLCDAQLVIYDVFLRFVDLIRDRMSVLISHRFPTVGMADRILVLEGGQIRGQGSHGQLVALGGRYAGYR
jgi:ATP-binding cassette, subfamily B, bacterial